MSPQPSRSSSQPLSKPDNKHYFAVDAGRQSADKTSVLLHKYITYRIQFYLSQTEDWCTPTWHGGVNKQQSPKAALILPPQKTYITSTIPVRYILFACEKKQKLEKVLVKPIAMLLNKSGVKGQSKP